MEGGHWAGWADGEEGRASSDRRTDGQTETDRGLRRTQKRQPQFSVSDSLFVRWGPGQEAPVPFPSPAFPSRSPSLLPFSSYGDGRCCYHCLPHCSRSLLRHSTQPSLSCVAALGAGGALGPELASRPRTDARTAGGCCERLLVARNGLLQRLRSRTSVWVQ